MSDPRERLQELAAMAAEIIAEMTEVAQENQIVSIPFLRGTLQFGVVFAGWDRYPDDTVSNIKGYFPAKGGATIRASEYEWQASHFECWPQEEEREWLFGDDHTTWPKTDYEIE